MAATVYICSRHGRWRPPFAPKEDDCTECWAMYGRWRYDRDQQQKVRSVGHARGGGQSSKKKGRSACLLVREHLLSAAPWLGEGDIFVKATSMMGVDIHLSPRALQVFPFALEVKNAESLNIWAALQQAAVNAGERLPVVFFKRANTVLYVALRADHFLSLMPCHEPTP